MGVCSTSASASACGFESWSEVVGSELESGSESVSLLLLSVSCSCFDVWGFAGGSERERVWKERRVDRSMSWSSSGAEVEVEVWSFEGLVVGWWSVDRCESLMELCVVNCISGGSGSRAGR